MTDKVGRIKELALNGDFDTIIADYGQKAVEKAYIYAKSKLTKLREASDQSVDMSPFLRFALPYEDAVDMLTISKAFISLSTEEPENMFGPFTQVEEKQADVSVDNDTAENDMHSDTTEVQEGEVPVECSSKSHVEQSNETIAPVDAVDSLAYKSKRGFSQPQSKASKASKSDISDPKALAAVSKGDDGSRAVKVVSAIKSKDKKLSSPRPRKDKDATATNPTKESTKRKAAMVASSAICQGYLTEKESDPSRKVRARPKSRELANEYGDDGDCIRNDNGGDSGSEYDMPEVESECDSGTEGSEPRPKVARNTQSTSSAPRKQISRKQLAADAKKKSPKTFNGKKPAALHQTPSKTSLKPPAKATAKVSTKQFSSSASNEAGIAKLKGFKQKHLPPQDDLLHAKIIPPARSSFPPDFQPTVGADIALIIDPYREFLSEIPADLLTMQELQDVESVFNLSKSFVFGKVQEVAEFQSETMSDGHFGAMLSILVAGSLFTVFHAPFSSALLTTDVYLLPVDEFKKSLKAPWLVKTAQVCKPFGLEDGSGVEWLEGNIYNIRNDMAKNPYNSISVVWVDRDAETSTWVYKYDQLDNECSPWDLKLSKFVLPEKVKAPQLPRALCVGRLTAMSIIDYIKSLDFTYVFKYNLAKNPEYCSMFPDKDDQLDLHTITRLCTQGRYSEADAIGITTLFRDLRAMAANGKRFNNENRGFQVWRLVDMLEKELTDLQVKLVETHNLQLGNLEECGDADECCNEGAGTTEPEEI